MNESWLRDALREATARQPLVADRTERAFARARRRQQQRTVAVSCVAALAVLATTVVTRGAGQPEGLRPASPSPTSSLTEGPAPAGSAAPSPATSPVERMPSPAGTAGDPAVEPAPGPPAREQVDVFVLFDATMSMTPAVEAVDATLHRLDAALRAGGVDLAWGLGIYRDFNPNPLLVTEPVYRRLRGIYPDGPMSSAGVEFRGGSQPSDEEWATIGLDGLAGIAHSPYSFGSNEANWRLEARRIVLLVTDAGIEENDQVPSIDDAVQTMLDQEIRVAGLHVLTHNDPQPAHRDIGRVVRGTGAFAARPVDCDGDGGPEVERGQALVCPVGPDVPADMSGFAKALIALPE